ncbi:MAG: type II secretion system protein [Gammaproteobacteria bacterium]
MQIHKIYIRSAKGITLIELIIVISIMSILATVIGPLIAKPMESYVAQNRRGTLVDNGQHAVEHMLREIHLAVPNSIRVNPAGTAIEFLRTVDGGRYREKTDLNNADVLQFTPNLDTAFDTIGSLETCSDPRMNVDGNAADCFNGVANCLVIGNRGVSAIPNVNQDIDAYNEINMATIKTCVATGRNGENKITYFNDRLKGLAGPPVVISKTFPKPVAGHRFQIVDTAVSYVCDLGTGEIRKYIGYGINPIQAVPPVGGTNSVLVTGVTACSFTSLRQSSHDILTAHIAVSADGESVSLMQQTRVSNTP